MSAATMVRVTGWLVMTVLALLVAAYAALVLVLPHFGAPLVAERRLTMPWALSAHLAGGLVALAIGPWQLNTRLRNRALGFHRWLGRVYVIAVVVGGIGGLVLATVSDHGLVTHLGFGVLAIVWLFTTFQAYRSIRARKIATHQRWMVRSYALTLAAVTLRIYLPLSLAVGIAFPTAYRVISWACWVPNLLVAEWFVRRRSASVDRSLVIFSKGSDPIGYFNGV